jgi:hypothetical protein
MTDEAIHIISLSNETASLSVDLQGGGIVDFHLPGDDINPLNFKIETEDMPEHNRSGASYRGHFVCMGRWGPPSAGEIKAGIPDHGQAANMIWEQTLSAQNELRMQVFAPLEGLQVDRAIELDEKCAVFKVTERITNINPLSRLYNVVQHPTLAAPFLTANTIVNCNAADGFNYKFSTNPLQHTAKWPYGIMEDGGTMNVSQPDKVYSSVFSYIIKKDAEFGWITAYTPEYNLLFGYIWQRETYPWVSLWQDFDNDAIRYRGLEFGTTSMHKPYKQIIEEGNHRVFGEASYLYIDAGETQEKRYTGFMIKTPDAFTEVSDVTMANGQLSVTETGGRQLNIQTTLPV